MSDTTQWGQALSDSADDLDLLEETSPKPGRVGRANLIRRLAADMENNPHGVRFLCACGCGSAVRLSISGRSVVGSLVELWEADDE